MVGEVGELAEIFQWKPDGSCPPGLSGWKDDKLVHLGEEMADVLLYLLRLADRCGIDLPMAAARKLQINGIKYPAEIVLGKSKKYNEYKQDWRSQKRAREEEDQSRSEEPSSKREKLASKPSKKRIIMLGLDGAGKTSILYRLKLGKIVATIPTSGFNVEMVPHKNVEFDIWDVGGAKDKRPLWSGFYENTDAVIFVVDATANEERNAEAEQEIKKVLAAQQLRGVPMLVMSNKQDLVQGKTAENDNVASMPLLSEPSIGAKVRTFQTSAATGEGLDACLDLLAEWTA